MELYLDHLSPFIEAVYMLFFHLIWIIAFVFWVAFAFKEFLLDVLELRKKKIKKRKYDTL